MDQLVNILLAIDKANTVPYSVLDCEPGLGGLKQVYEPVHPTSSAIGIYDKYNNILTNLYS